tara:strand:- start:12690 stop:14405 length:1716 start_codon:yes stop_codon:yes gene_type:complete
MGYTTSLLTGVANYQDEDRAGGERWRELMEVLWHMWRRDVRDVEDQRKELYPKNHDRHLLMAAPLVNRLSKELATLYVQPPARSFVGPVTEATAARINRIYESAEINTVLRTAQECLAALNQATVWVFPVPKIGGVRLVLVPPHEQAIVMEDPTSHDERDVKAWTLRMPVEQDEETGGLHYATARITKDQAVYIDGPEGVIGTGVYAEDLSNPIGMIPAIRLKGSLPAMGEFWCPCPEDLVAAQRALAMSLMDQQHLARMQGHGQPVISGLPIAAAKEIQLGPETVVGLTDEQASFEYVQADPRLSDYKEITQYFLDTVVALNGLSPSSVLKSSAITALAKRLEMLDRDTERRRMVQEMSRCETRLFKIIRAWVNWQRGVEVLPEAKVEMSYREPALVVDALHEQQAASLRIQQGISTSAQELARIEGISLLEARQRVEQNRLEQIELEELGGRSPQLAAGQMASALEVVAAVQSGALLPSAGVTLLTEGLGMSTHAATRIIASAGGDLEEPAPEPIALRGQFPLYRTRAEAEQAGGGEAHEHYVDGVTYFMPSNLEPGVTQFHGDYPGDL